MARAGRGEGLRWGLALGGLFLLMLAVLALSGPGRIDIIDGHARYLVTRSLLEHGDPEVREPSFWFTVLPGRDGKRYSQYRFPFILLGVPALWLADATGPVSEVRRQFFFCQVSPVLGALLAVVYATWFRGLGWSPLPAVGWAAAGVLATPCWYYSTSTFDDILGTFLTVTTLVLAWQGRQRGSLLLASLAGLVLGLAVNAKQPLGLFALPALALLMTASAPWKTRVGGAALFLGGVALGVAAYLGYEWYKFPPGTTAEHAGILRHYVQPWPGNLLAGVCGLLVSPGAGMFWFCPPVLLGLAGLLRWRRREPLFCAALALACVGFFLFISSLSFFKGDLSWGPRYLTPLFALLWLFAPAAALAWPVRLSALLIGLGVVVQLLGLSVDPLRLYVTYRLPSGFYEHEGWIYFHPAISHLATRPREILEICTEDGSATTTFTPATLPTGGDSLPEEAMRGPEAVRAYRIYASFRPWWISYQWLAPGERPVALLPTVGLLGLLGLAGAGLLVGGLWPRGRPVPEEPPGGHGQAEAACVVRDAGGGPG